MKLLSLRSHFSSSSRVFEVKKYKLPTRYNGVKFVVSLEDTPKLTRKTSPNYAPSEILQEAPVEWSKYAASFPKRKHSVNAPIRPVFKTLKELLNRPKEPIRFRARPTLPTTFPKNHSLKSWLKAETKTPRPLTRDPGYYPYTYYEITLHRGFIGLNNDLKQVANSLGLYIKDQIIYRHVDPRVAGKILKIKELVKVRLVNEIPTIYAAVPGYKKIDNVLGTPIC